MWREERLEQIKKKNFFLGLSLAVSQRCFFFFFTSHSHYTIQRQENQIRLKISKNKLAVCPRNALIFASYVA